MEGRGDGGGIKHLVTKDLSYEECEKLLKKGYVWLDEYMYKPGGDTNSILARIPNVIARGDSGSAVMFLHLFELRKDEPMTLQIKCGIMPDGHTSCLVKNLRQKIPPNVMSLPPPSDRPVDLLTLVDEALDYMKALCSDNRVGRLRPRCLRLLLLALGDAAPIIYLQDELEPRKSQQSADDLVKCGEEYLLKKDEVTFQIKMAVSMIRHSLYNDTEIRTAFERAKVLSSHINQLNKHWIID